MAQDTNQGVTYLSKVYATITATYTVMKQQTNELGGKKSVSEHDICNVFFNLANGSVLQSTTKR